MTTVEILRKAKQILEERGWRRGYGTFGDGGPCCVLRAFDEVTGKAGTSHSKDGYWTFRAANPAAESSGVGVWNDAPGRTLPEVLDAFDRAIALAEATP